MENHVCNETYKTSKSQWNSIMFTFLTEDGNTPRRCLIRAGEIDPMTGEQIDEEYLRAWHMMRNREIDHNLKAERAPYTKSETAARKLDRAAIREELEAMCGYASEDAVEVRLEERWGTRYNLHMDAAVNEDGGSCADLVIGVSAPSAEDEYFSEADGETGILREFAASLSGRMLDVYQMMLERAGGGAERTQGKELARKWGVCEATIVKDRKRIEKMIRRLF